MTLTVFLTFLLLVANASKAQKATFFQVYECNNNKCQRVNPSIDYIELEYLRSHKKHTTLASCRLVCDKYAALWPLPTRTIDVATNYINVNPSDFYFELSNVPKSSQPFITKVTDLFVENLWLTCGQNCNSGNATVSVHVRVNHPDEKLNWNTSEKYELDLKLKGSKVTINITADTVFGARHAFETLLQLTAPVQASNDERGLVILEYATIIDEPLFAHRGLLIDTARNFLPVSDIFRTIDGLASVKMNVLHWHATDSQSFPLQIKNVPLMAHFGAYAPDKVYTVQDMKDVVSYASIRGVRVILELDTPSHAGAGWEWGESEGLGKLAVCVNRQPWRDFCIQPPCGQLNPVNPNTFQVLTNIYRDLLDIWDAEDLIHLGGDELFFNCWNATPEVTSAMQSRGMGRGVEDFLQLWAEFHTEQLKSLDLLTDDRSSQKILWSSHLTSPEIIEKYLNKSRFVIQTWVENNSELNNQLLDRGYRLIISTKNAWYLDHGFWGRTNYHTWKDVYNNRIPRKQGVIGGEVCMWGEYVVSGSLHSRVWPRTSAAAERLWSDPNEPVIKAESRLQAHRERLEYRGIYPDAITPEWCNQHDAQCL